MNEENLIMLQQNEQTNSQNSQTSNENEIKPVKPETIDEIALQIIRNRLYARYKEQPELIKYIEKISYEAGISAKQQNIPHLPAIIPGDIKSFAADLERFKSNNLSQDEHLALAEVLRPS
jgi:hypothetical protein